MARRAFFQFEDNGPEKANFKFDKCDKVKAVFKIDPPTVNYELLINKPKINHVELIGDKSLEDLGIITAITNLIHEHNISEDAHEYIRNLIYQETADREAADTILQQNIDEEARVRAEQDSAIREALEQEAIIRTEQDQLLQRNIEQEAQERQSTDQTLQTNIDNEARDRQIADNNLHGEVVAESLLRENADTILGGQITAETTAREQADTALGNRIDSIDELIPVEASSSNKLADKEFVVDKIKTYGASFRGSWATWASVPTNPNLYPEDADGNRTPDANDYMIVVADETQDGGTWKYVYTGVWTTDEKSGWKAEYEIEKSPFTPEQQAAIDSGITSALVGQITTNENDISDINTTLSGYGNIVTHNVNEFATASQGALADTAVQPDDLAEVATSGDYEDLTNKPTIGSGTITFIQGEEEKGSINVNQTGDTVITLDKGGDDLFNIDGGKANSVYIIDIQKIDGGNAEG